MANEKTRNLKEIALKGRLITGDDPASVAENFQSLKNMRYWKDHLRGIGGMTKITPSIINSSYYKVRSAIHFKKDQPSESHILVQAFNSSESSSRILDNKTEIPNTGDFESSELYAPSGVDPGMFAVAPNGAVAYCNGEETCVYGGEEHEIGGFINYDPDGTFSYDFTDQVRNKKTDVKNKAVLNSTSAGIDSNTVLIMHLDDNLTDDSPTTPHTVTGNNITFDSVDYVFGTHSAILNGTDSYASTSADSDFNFSDGSFEIDLRVKVNSLSSDNVLYFQQTDSERYIKFYINTTGALVFDIYNSPTTVWTGSTTKSLGDAVIPTSSNGYFYECTTAGTTDSSEPIWPTTEGETVTDGSVVWTCHAIVDFSIQTEASVISTDTWNHVEVDENANDFYLFVGGTLKAYESSVARAINYSGQVQIGTDGASYLDGKIDEYRISDTYRHTGNFEAPTEAYSTSSESIYLYIGSIMPLDGFKLYVGTANVSTSSMLVYYWNGTAWKNVSNLSDGTSSGGISLAQTGLVEFDSTANYAKAKYLNNVYVYWYKIVIDSVSANTSITYATVSIPFQPIKDIWAGVPSDISSFFDWNDGRYRDYTLNVMEDSYSPLDEGTYWKRDDFDDHLLFGFDERMAGINLRFAKGNNDPSVATIQYWNGTSWVSVGDIDDGTMKDGKTFNHSGTISWCPPSPENEFKKSINNGEEFYYYRFSSSKEFSDDVELVYVTGVPAQKEIGAYKVCALAHNRLWLCNSEKENKNSAIYSAEGTLNSFNGEDSGTFYFGDDSEITQMAWLYSQYGSSLYNVTLFFKKNEIWAIVGDDPESWKKYRVSGTIGCVAKDTMKLIDLDGEIAPDLKNSVVIFQSEDGIYITDGRSPVKISKDIDDVFDKRNPNSINIDRISDSQSVWDFENKEYHFMYSSGSSTTLDKEMVFSFKKKAWFEIERPSSKQLQYAIEIKDTGGTTYNYGFIDAGYMLRLEDGNDFDGDDIHYEFQFGDIALAEGSIMTETSIEHQALVSIAKTNTTNDLTITHYGDSKNSGESFTESQQKSGYRLSFPVKHKGKGAHVFHSWKFQTSTNNETIGFEPLFFAVIFTRHRDHTRDWRE